MGLIIDPSIIYSALYTFNQSPIVQSNEAVVAINQLPRQQNKIKAIRKKIIWKSVLSIKQKSY